MRLGLSGLLIATLAAGCGSGGGANPPTPAAIQQVAGSLTIGTPELVTSSSGARSPAFVSAGTHHAAIFIDGATAAAGTSTCTTTGTTGATGTTACTISWTAQVAVPAPHVFAVEIDSGPAGTPANTVLGEGRGSFALVAGNANALATLTLNGVAADATYTVTSCTATACAGNVQLGASDGNLIAYTGTITVPTATNNPSNGTVYDNGNVTFVSSNAAAGGGLITGTAQTSGANVFSTYATNTLTVSGVNTTGTYTYQVTCTATGTGTFGITAALAGSPSLDVTSAELAALSPAVSYPSAITVLGAAPSFGCTTGTIGDATGAIPVN